MNNEREHTHSFKVEFAHLDNNSYVKPHGYQHIISKAIDEHLILFDMDTGVNLEQEYSWVLIALNVEIKKHIQGCANVHIQTWFSERKRLCFRREVEARDDAGDVIFVASVYSVLIDLKTHSVYRKAELPFKLMDANPEFLLDSKPAFKEELQYEKVCERKVYRSHIDALGHVNNCRYGEFAFDALTDEYADMTKIKGFDIYFCSELKQDEIFTVEQHIQNIKDKIVLHGYNNSNKKTSFYSVFYFN